MRNHKLQEEAARKSSQSLRSLPRLQQFSAPQQAPDRKDRGKKLSSIILIIQTPLQADASFLQHLPNPSFISFVFHKLCMRIDDFDVESHKLPETRFLWHLLLSMLYWHNHCASDGLLSHCSTGWKNYPVLNVKAILYNVTQPSLLGNLSYKTVAVAIQKKRSKWALSSSSHEEKQLHRKRYRKQCKSVVVLLKSGLSRFLRAVECTAFRVMS